jgi:cobalt-precorrin 5A hydrolase
VGNEHSGERFRSIIELTHDIFDRYAGLVYVAPCGVVVRAVAPNLEHKTTDPAVVVVDVCARFAVSLLSGHEGGANDLTLQVANILGAEPVITTTTEARRNLIVGIGCKRGTPAEKIIDAVEEGLREAGLDSDHVRLLASADIKSDEAGLIAAAQKLGLPLRFIGSDEIRNTPLDFGQSDFVQEKVNLPAVAEPAALLAGRRTRLVLNKRRYDGVTVAVARESCSW